MAKYEWTKARILRWTLGISGWIFSMILLFTVETLMGLFVGALLFWIDIIIALSLQWFVPIRSTFHNKFRKCLKKCFIIFMDNTGFSIIMGLYHLLLTALSILPIGFFPSITGLSISKHNAFRLRMYKYDYLEEHPELTTAKDRKKIPCLLYQANNLLRLMLLPEQRIHWHYP